MANIPTLEVKIAVAVSDGGLFSVHPYCQYHTQINQRYIKWRDEHRGRGSAISVVHARVPIPESMINADFVSSVNEDGRLIDEGERLIDEEE